MKFSEELAFGAFGGEVITNTVAHSGGSWGVIQALEDTVIASLTSTTVNQNKGTATGVNYTLTSVPLAAGVALFGYFTAIQLTSGAVFCGKIPSVEQSSGTTVAMSS